MDLGEFSEDFKELPLKNFEISHEDFKGSLWSIDIFPQNGFRDSLLQKIKGIQWKIL